MLNVNPEGQSWQDVWKVLIYDQHCSQILSPLITVNELREQAVTLPMCAPTQSPHSDLTRIHVRRLITSERQAIDVPAVYFVQPTRENIDLIVRVCESALCAVCTL